jgi:hypothetical protein
MFFAAIFAIVVGTGMIIQWLTSYFQRQIPELKTEPIRIGFHLAGELATSLALIISGTGLLTGSSWADTLFLVASGMLLYTAIVSPGYFAQQGQWLWVVIFGILVSISIMTILTI